MRKLALIGGMLVLFCASFLVCYIFSNPAVPASPFSVNGPFSAQSAVDVATGDSIVTIASSTPFYSGAQSPLGQQTQGVDDLRAKKVAEIVSTASSLAGKTDRMASEVDTLEKAYLDYLDVARKKQTDLAKMVGQTLHQLTQDSCKAAAAGACCRALPNEGATPHTTATVQYLKALKSMEYALLEQRRLNDVSAFAAIAYNHGQKSQDPTVKQALQALDSAMRGMDGLAASAKSADEDIAGIRYGLRQLETGDYYYARASVDFMRATLPDVQAKLKNLQPSQELPAAQVKMAKDFGDDLQAAVDKLQRRLDAVDTKRLVQLPDYQPPIGIAYAGGSDQRAFFKAGQAYMTKQQIEAGKGSAGLGDVAATTWEGIKRAPGMAVEMTEFEVKNVMRRAMGLYYGSSQEDTEKDVHEYENEVDKHFRENTMGTESFRTAKGAMNYLEDTCQKKAEDFMSESNIPLANSAIGSKVTGLIAKGTVSVLTGFAKGVYALCDRSSTNGELAEGSLEIACSLFGGTKMLPTPKMLGNGTQQFLGWAGSKIGGAMVNLAESTIGKKQLYEEVIRNGAPLLVNFLERRIGYATTTLINSTRASLKEELLQMTKAGLFAAGENAKEVAAKSLYEFAKKEFTLGMSGFAESLGAMYGANISEFMATMTGQTLDDLLKALVKETLDSVDGAYSGSVYGQASGQLGLFIKNGAVTGHISGSYQGDGFSCRLNGTCQSGNIECELTGTLTDSNGTGTYPFSGSMKGSVKDGKATGSYGASNSHGGGQGGWSATLK